MECECDFQSNALLNRSVAILFGKTEQAHIGLHFGGIHIPEDAQWRSTFEHMLNLTQIKKEGWWMKFGACLHKGDVTHVQKVQLANRNTWKYVLLVSWSYNAKICWWCVNKWMNMSLKVMTTLIYKLSDMWSLLSTTDTSTDVLYQSLSHFSIQLSCQWKQLTTTD